MDSKIHFNGVNTSCLIQVEILCDLVKTGKITKEAILSFARIIELQSAVETVIPSVTDESAVQRTQPGLVDLQETEPAANSANPPPPTIDKQILADRYGVRVRTINRWMHNGWIPFIKIGKVVRFDPGQVDAALKLKFGRNCSRSK
jgi:excisionase family DNA binding protein